MAAGWAVSTTFDALTGLPARALGMKTAADAYALATLPLAVLPLQKSLGRCLRSASRLMLNYS